MKLNEVFDKPYNFKWMKKDIYEVIAEFFTDAGLNYIVSFEKYGGSINYDDSWDINFKASVKTSKETAKKKFAGKFGQGITGAGDQQKVFSTVLSVINKFIKEKKPNILTFSAVEPSRRKLYMAIINKFANKAGYEISKIRNGNYTLERK